MGNLCGKPKDVSPKETHKPPGDATSNVKKLIVPKWKSDEPMSVEQLRQEREQFWDTQPHYGGNRGARHGMLLYFHYNVIYNLLA